LAQICLIELYYFIGPNYLALHANTGESLHMSRGNSTKQGKEDI